MEEKQKAFNLKNKVNPLKLFLGWFSFYFSHKRLYSFSFQIETQPQDMQYFFFNYHHFMKGEKVFKIQPELGFLKFPCVQIY